MIVTFANGRKVRAVILARSENEIRAALEGSEDTTRFVTVNGRWVSDDCEPVQIEFTWQSRTALPPPEEADCICPKDLAAKLIRFLYYGEPVSDPEPTLACEPHADSRAHQVI